MSAIKSADNRPQQVQDEVKRLASGYTRLQRALEFSGVTLFGGLTVYTLIQLVQICQTTALGGGTIAVALVLAFFGGLLFADFASGFVHWAADNWGSADWPILGSAFIRPFRLHHLDATDITHHTFLELNGNNCIVSLPLFWVASHLLRDSAWGLFLGAFWVSVAVWVMATNQFHAWAHTEHPPAWVQAMQRARLILSTPHHDMHHRVPHARNYCITTGWFNGPLRAIKFFEGLEWMMTRIVGVEAHHHQVERDHKRGELDKKRIAVAASQALKTE